MEIRNVAVITDEQLQNIREGKAVNIHYELKGDKSIYTDYEVQFKYLKDAKEKGYYVYVRKGKKLSKAFEMPINPSAGKYTSTSRLLYACARRGKASERHGKILLDKYIVADIIHELALNNLNLK